jgi:hypothetical protein
MPSLLLLALVFTAILVVARTPANSRLLGVIDGALSGRMLPAVAFVGGIGVTAYVWGGLHPIAVYHDEAAYLLQAELFARFRWSLPAPIVPRAFEQAAVLVTPVLAPKMGPGHALALTPGVWLGVPALMPLLLTGCTASLLVLLVRRIAGATVAALALIFWLTASGNLIWRPTFFSETSSGVAWLGAWWSLLEWRESRQSRWLLATAALTGWGAITRPLTFLAFVLPLGVVVLRDVVRARLWRQLAGAIVLGSAFLAVVPLQAWRVTGSPRTTPLGLYTRQYLPSDVMGFGLHAGTPERPLPPDLVRVYGEFDALHAGYTLASLPRTFGERAATVFNMQFGGWRAPLAPVMLAGMLSGMPAVAFSLVTALLVLVAYLGYAHLTQWSVYYIELLPVLSFVFGLGFWRVFRWLARLVRRAELPAHAGALAVVLVTVLSLQPTVREVAAYRRRIERISAYQRQFADAMAQVPEPKALVFVRYGSGHLEHYSIVRNVADPQRAHIVTAYDLGPAANDSVRAAFPDRAVYVLDTDARSLQKVIFER